MKTDELIRALRTWAEALAKKLAKDKSGDGAYGMKVLTEAADRLEDLDERVAIMSESKTGKWERHYSRPNVYADLSWWCSNCGEKCLDNWANKYQYCPHCGARMEGAEHDRRERKTDRAD